MAALDEGLAKVPDNPWLLLRKAVLLITQQQPEEARKCVAKVLDQQPDHLGAAVLQTRLVLATEGPVAAASQFQHALSHAGAESRSTAGEDRRDPGRRAGQAACTSPRPCGTWSWRSALDDSEQSILPLGLSLGEGKPDDLSLAQGALPPERAARRRLTGPKREQFESALAWAREGLWESAASAFELLTADPAAGLAAERNLGLCRLWLGDEEAAGSGPSALARPGASDDPDAADLAVLCQMIDQSPDSGAVEHVRLSWPPGS